MAQRIIWNNVPESIYSIGVTEPIITYSNIEGDSTWFGVGNINADPLFTDLENGDYTLQEDSPCIDAGDPDSPWDPDGTIADMGAYYFHQTSGCTNPEACNYDEAANVDDCSCLYDDCTGECGGQFRTVA